MNMLSTTIVTSEKIDSTRPVPMSTSAPAASPRFATRSSARLSSLSVMSYFSFASRSVGFSSNTSFRSCVYSGRFSASLTACSTSGGIRITPITTGRSRMPRYTSAMARPRGSLRLSRLTGPEAATARKAARKT
jgi:hypothetical protein